MHGHLRTLFPLKLGVFTLYLQTGLGRKYFILGHIWKKLKASAWGMTVGGGNRDGEESRVFGICCLSRNGHTHCFVPYNKQ